MAKLTILEALQLSLNATKKYVDDNKFSKNYEDLNNEPFATVATTGSYNDLTDKPTIPTIPNSLPANGGNADTVNNFRLWKGTQAQYDAITTKDSNTIYMITE